MNTIKDIYFSTVNLKLAYHRIICWPDRLVKDRFGINAFGNNFDQNLKELSSRIIEGNYSPKSGFKYYEPKSSGTQRTKTLLMIEDALVYQAIANVIGQRAYPKLVLNESFVFGSVLSSEVQQGIKVFESNKPNFFFFKFWKSLFGKFKDSVIKAIEEDKSTFKLETDITGFFDSIPHYNLLLTLSSEFDVEDEILDLLSVCLNAWSGTKENGTPGVGIPQGPLPSYFFANLLLYPLDKQVINEAFKYYRYMDDIKIYGYSEEELLDVLVHIDNYLKGHGLSINSKKTSIKKIDPNKEDETVRDFKRHRIIVSEIEGSEYEPDSNQTSNSNINEIEKNISSLIEQTSDSIEDSNIETISNQEDVISFWENEIKTVESELPALFKANSVELKNKETTDDIDFIRYSAKYGSAIRALREIKWVESNPELLKYWLFALGKYFWRAKNYVITLQYYRDNPTLKDALFSLYSWGKNYEWYRYHIINCLTYNFKFKDKELRDIFKMLKNETSDLVKYATCCLIIKHSNDYQLLSTLKSQLSKEQSEYLKLIVLEYWKKDEDREETMLDLLKSVGL